jgi:hypothetical protein
MSEICNAGCAPHEVECRSCKQVKPENEFEDLGTYISKTGKVYNRPNYKRKICNVCRNLQKRDAGLRQRYGISLEEYSKILEIQNGVCAICNEKCPTGRNLAVDHCHATGKVRGLLCVRCNQGLGHFMDKEDLINNMLNYVRIHKHE